MARWISAAACRVVGKAVGIVVGTALGIAVVMSLSVTLAEAQTATSPGSGTKAEQRQSADANKAIGKAPDAILAGCVVRDAANGGHPTIASNGISYELTGKSPAELGAYLGKRVEVIGTLTTGTGARATSGTTADDHPAIDGSRTRSTTPKGTIDGSTTPKDLTATGGQSDVTATGVARDNTVPADPSTEIVAPGGTPRQASQPEVPLATDRGTTADLTGRMQIKTVRVLAPNCL